MSYLTEFPNFDGAYLPTIPTGFVDQSWRNDTCPSWQQGDLWLFIDYAAPCLREMAETPRYSLQRRTDEGDQFIADTDDWQEILRHLS